jgi:hypothetical protein
VTPVVISARGQAAPTATADLAIASLTVGGRVERANILAGYNLILDPVNADAQIGPAVVGGDWIASNLVGGVAAGDDGYFGTDDDVPIPEAGQSPAILARIDSVLIRGQALGTLPGINPDDHYGIVAELIGSAGVGETTALPLAAGPGNDDIPLGVTGDLRVLEVSAP